MDASAVAALGLRMIQGVNEQRNWQQYPLFGVPIDVLSVDGTLDLIDRVIGNRDTLHIGVVNAAKLVNMRRDELLRESVLESDIILADGMAVVWALRILGKRLPGRVPGIDLMFGMLKRGQSRGYRVYCLGASEEVVSTVVARIESDFPGVEVAGYRNGYFKPEDEAEIVENIKASRADMLFVAISPPKKEQFMGRWAKEMNIPVCHGVGGSFDVMAGKVRRAPELWQKMGMEWLYRVVQEPRRMWRRYLVTNTLFGWMLIREWFARLWPGKQPRVE